MSIIQQNLEALKSDLSDDCTVVAVSKTHPVKYIEQAFMTGHLDFGENKVQELVHKYQVLPKKIKWHMIGHLQRNKVKYIAPFIHLIHSVDSLRLLEEINKQANQFNRVINCLIQVCVAEETTKFGFEEDEVYELFESNKLTEFKGVNIVGIMGMATNTTNKLKIRSEFGKLKIIYDNLTQKNHANTNLQYLSMGMSSDYKIAILEGSNMIRVGSAIFGKRTLISN